MISKNIIRLCSVLESYSGLLYHATQYTKALDILLDHKIKTGSEGRISFSRTASFWFMPSELDVRIILEGSKLSQNYRLDPYSDPSLQIVPYTKAHNLFEYEMVSYKPILNLERYLVGVELSHFLNNKDALIMEEMLRNEGYRASLYLRDKLFRQVNKTYYDWRKSL